MLCLLCWVQLLPDVWEITLSLLIKGKELDAAGCSWDQTEQICLRSGAVIHPQRPPNSGKGKYFFFAEGNRVINEEWLGATPVPGSLATVGGFVCEILRGCTVAPCTQNCVMKVVLPWSSLPWVSASGPRRSKVGWCCREKSHGT